MVPRYSTAASPYCFLQAPVQLAALIGVASEGGDAGFMAQWTCEGVVHATTEQPTGGSRLLPLDAEVGAGFSGLYALSQRRQGEQSRM
jgi:hypothetical protein